MISKNVASIVSLICFMVGITLGFYICWNNDHNAPADPYARPATFQDGTVAYDTLGCDKVLVIDWDQGEALVKHVSDGSSDEFRAAELVLDPSKCLSHVPRKPLKYGAVGYQFVIPQTAADMPQEAN